MYYDPGPRITEPVRSSKAAIEKQSVRERRIADIVAQFRENSLMAGIRESTLMATSLYLRQYLQWVSLYHDDERFVPTSDIRSYRNHLLQAGKYTNGTINNKLGAVSTYYRFLVIAGVLRKNPVTRDCYVKKRQGLHANLLTIADMGRFLSGIRLSTPFDYLFKSVCETLYSSGLRISECMGLQEKDIDAMNGYIMIHDLKGNRQRSVPIGEVALRWMGIYREKGREKLVSTEAQQSGYIYPQGKTWKDRIIIRMHAECQQRGFPAITPHGLRHSCATHMLKKGANIKQIQEFLGHEQIKSTQVYTHIGTDDLKQLVMTYHPRGS